MRDINFKNRSLESILQITINLTKIQNIKADICKEFNLIYKSKELQNHIPNQKRQKSLM